MEDRPTVADIPRREPVYEPQETIQFPSAGGLDGAHTDVDGKRETTTGYLGRADRQLNQSVYADQVGITVTVPVRVVKGIAGGQPRGGSRKAITLFNFSGNTIFISGNEAACTAGIGFPLLSNTGFTWDKEPWGEIWVLAPSASVGVPADIRIMLEQGYGGDNDS